MAFLIILAAALLFLIQYLIANEFYVIAQDKGYPRKKYLWLPFFLGPIGYLLVVALPDHSGFAPTYNEASKETPPKNDFEATPRPTSAVPVDTKVTPVSATVPVVAKVTPVSVSNECICCPICGQSQPADRNVCWNCGAKFERTSEN